MEEKKEKTYIIECNEKQLRMINEMCDRMSRLICGQLDASVQEYCEDAWERDHKTVEHPHGIGGDEWHAMRKELESHLAAIKKLCWDKDYGIYYDNNADILWEMHEVIRHQLWLDMPEDKRTPCTVDASPAISISNEPLIKVHRKGVKK